MRISSNMIHAGGVNAILDQQDNLAKTQQQVATGKRVLTPSDDPVGSTQILNFKQEIELTERFQVNLSSAESRVKLQETSLFSVTGVLRRVRDLLVQAGNGTYSGQERAGIAAEIQERLGEVLGLANGLFAGTEYLFSGSKTDVQPFASDGAGGFVYNGDQELRQIQINASIKVTVADSGYEVFQHIRNGNGDFSTRENATNAGGGVINAGSVIDSTLFNANPTDSYRIFITTSPTGQLEYNVENTTTATPILSNIPYQDGAAISFDGRSVKITGTPVTGDEFTLVPSRNQDLFTTLQNAVNALLSPGQGVADQGHLKNALGRALTDIDQAMDHIDAVHVDVGSRLNVLESERFSNEDFLLAAKTSLSTIEDVNIVEAISLLQAQQYTLQAAQQSFVQVQNLTLFNYLS